MVKLVERKFNSKQRQEEINKKKVQLLKHLSPTLDESLADLLYVEIRRKILMGVIDEETELFQRYGLDK